MAEINDISDPDNLDPKEKKEAREKKDKAHDALPPIIKKIKKGGHGHHGGAWKIAYADFVTAMMAFFLLMWLVASLNKAQKAGIAEYFRQPMKVALFGGNSTGNRKDVVAGGGPNIEDTDGQVTATNKPLKSDEKIASETKTEEGSSDELKKLEQLKSEINLSMEKDPSLAGLKKQLLMDVVSEGLRIQLIDNQKKPMFDVGSDQINPEIEPILANLAKLLNSVPNKITIQGHTDASPYDNPQELEYTNWELSTQRANAARRALIKLGMDENKVMTITGFSSTILLDKNNPYNPENRRISIIVMKKGAETKIMTNQ
ncbi:flagellar motor protein MotB [Legionella waltersii]|uniref:Flagellar motor protein MotB n=1 Tax=Legionella waltersii TaxID=66969 RepID=A0A0W1AGY4_9GAMM|nr:flagellar motor protein MotB [Legionella waltersii]KTD80510.1 flagellar motor protein MotB [Legionella waltersii]SNV09556.1 chemotaxis protein MotB [Legionella waltersii]